MRIICCMTLLLLLLLFDVCCCLAVVWLLKSWLLLSKLYSYSCCFCILSMRWQRSYTFKYMCVTVCVCRHKCNAVYHKTQLRSCWLCIYMWCCCCCWSCPYCCCSYYYGFCCCYYYCCYCCCCCFVSCLHSKDDDSALRQSTAPSCLSSVFGVWELILQIWQTCSHPIKFNCGYHIHTGTDRTCTYTPACRSLYIICLSVLLSVSDRSIFNHHCHTLAKPLKFS